MNKSSANTQKAGPIHQATSDDSEAFDINVNKCKHEGLLCTVNKKRQKNKKKIHRFGSGNIQLTNKL